MPPVGRLRGTEMQRAEISHTSRRSGLTLVEMFVVMSIILGLLALLLPAVQHARESSRRTACQSNLRQIGLAFRLYAQVHQGWPGLCPVNRLGGWAIDILPFAEQQPLAKQLEANPSLDPQTISPATYRRPALLTCPSAGDAESSIPNVPVSHYASTPGHAADAPSGSRVAWIESPAMPPNYRQNPGPHDGGFNELTNAETVRWVPGASR
jgi:type II secretory pathway pseudopilin PulG